MRPRALPLLTLLLPVLAQDGQFASATSGRATSVLVPTDPALRRAPYLDPRLPLEQRVEDLYARLTPEERIGLLHGTSGYADFGDLPRVGLPRLRMTDGPQGVRTDVPTTGFPSGIAMAATWDPALVERAGRILGRETRATGRSVLLGPGVNLLRTPLAGRNFEYFGEDPLLSGRTAAAYIRGVQSEGVAACIKHVALNDQEVWRLGVSSEASERTLRELHLRPFEIAIREAGPWSAMPAYNRVNGRSCAQNAPLLRDLFTGAMGFRGTFVSDWGAWGDTVEALAGGCHLEMPAQRDAGRDRAELSLLRAGAIRPEHFEAAVKAVLRLCFRVGALDGPRPEAKRLAEDAVTTARRLSREAMVLLKNEGGLLPLRAASLRRLLVVGPNADRRHSMRKGGQELLQCGGSGAILPPWEATVLEALRSRLGDRVEHYAGELDQGRLDGEGLRAAARRADLVLFVGGLSHADDHEGNCPPTPDRLSHALPGRQAELLQLLAEANPRTVAVMVGGTPMSLEPWADAVPALLMGWYPGMEGNHALVELLLGDASPSGRLPFTLGRSLQDWRVHALGPEAYPGLRYDGQGQVVEAPRPWKQSSPGQTKVFYKEGMALGYRGFALDGKAPRFTFGHGLTYGRFQYGPARVQEERGRWRVTCTLRNTGLREAAEVVQLYACPPEDTQSWLESRRPLRGLAAYAKVRLKPGASRRVELTLGPEELRHWDEARAAWAVAPGTWTFEVAASSVDIRQRVPVKVR